MKLSIGHLYPELFNLYGDRGNVQCLLKRLQWRGIDAGVTVLPAGEKIDFNGLDIICWGGGSHGGSPAGGKKAWGEGVRGSELQKEALDAPGGAEGYEASDAVCGCVHRK